MSKTLQEYLEKSVVCRHCDNNNHNKKLIEKHMVNMLSKYLNLKIFLL